MAASALLSRPDQTDERPHIHQPHLLRFRIARMQALRQHELHPLCLHLPCLVFADAWFKRQKVFVRNAGSLVEDLPPSVLAGRFGCQHRQARLRKICIVVLANAGEDEIRLQLVFGHAASRVSHSVIDKYLFKMVFQRGTARYLLRFRTLCASLMNVSVSPFCASFRSCSPIRCFSSVRNKISSRSVRVKYLG